MLIVSTCLTYKHEAQSDELEPSWMLHNVPHAWTRSTGVYFGSGKKLQASYIALNVIYKSSNWNWWGKCVCKHRWG